MPRGPIPLRAHAMIEPVAALLLILGPWIFGFSDVGSSTAVSIVVGAIMLLAGALTRWRWSLAKVIPLRTHFRTDVLLGIVLIVAPFVLGDSDNGAATRFLVIMGALELLTAFSTRWDPAEEVTTSTRGTAATSAR
jgi:hypothetical protein